MESSTAVVPSLQVPFAGSNTEVEAKAISAASEFQFPKAIEVTSSSSAPKSTLPVAVVTDVAATLIPSNLGPVAAVTTPTAVHGHELSATNVTVSLQQVSLPAACDPVQAPSSGFSAPPGTQELFAASISNVPVTDSISVAAPALQSAPNDLALTAQSTILPLPDSSVDYYDLQNFDFDAELAAWFPPTTVTSTDSKARIGLGEPDVQVPLSAATGLEKIPSANVPVTPGNGKINMTTPQPPVTMESQTHTQAQQEQQAPATLPTVSDAPTEYSTHQNQKHADDWASNAGQHHVRHAANNLSQALARQPRTPLIYASKTHNLTTSLLCSPFDSPFDQTSYDPSPCSTLSYPSQTTPQDAVEVDWLSVASMPFQADELAMLGEHFLPANPTISTPQANPKAYVSAPQTTPSKTTATKRKRSDSAIKGPAPKHARKNSGSNPNMPQYDMLPLLRDSVDPTTYKHIRQRSYEQPQAWPPGVEKYYNTGPAPATTSQRVVHHQQHQHYEHYEQQPFQPIPEQFLQGPTQYSKTVDKIFPSDFPVQLQALQDSKALGVSHNNPSPGQVQAQAQVQPVKRSRNKLALKFHLANLRAPPPMPTHQEEMNFLQPRILYQRQQHMHHEQQQNMHHQQQHISHQRQLSNTQPKRANTNTAKSAKVAKTPAPPSVTSGPPPSATRKTSTNSTNTRPRPTPTLATLSTIFAESRSRWLQHGLCDPIPTPSQINRATGFDYPVPCPTGVLGVTDGFEEIRKKHIASELVIEID